MDTGLVRRVARGLRYRPLKHLIGRKVEVPDLDRIEDAVRAALGPDFPEGCRLAGPEKHYLEGALARYCVLDLSFTAPDHLLRRPRRDRPGQAPMKSEDKAAGPAPL